MTSHQAPPSLGFSKLPLEILQCMKVKIESEVAQSCLTLNDLRGLQATRLLCPWGFPGKSTGVGCHCLLQRIFLTQGSNPGLPHCRQTLYHLSHQGNPSLLCNVHKSFWMLDRSSVHFSSVAQLYLTLCDSMNCSTPGLPVHHQLPEFTQTHVHRVSDAIQPSHPLSSPSPPTPNPSQHQSLFQWVNSSHEVAKVLEFQL